MQYCDETEGSNHGSDSDDEEEDEDRVLNNSERRNGIREQRKKSIRDEAA